MTQYYTFLHHKMIFLPIQNQFVSWHISKTIDKLVKQLSKEESKIKILSINTSICFQACRQIWCHISLKGSRGDAQSKWHPYVGNNTIRACERCFLLILTGYNNLVIHGVPIQKIIVLVTGNPLQHLINERDRKMIFPCYSVEPFVINTHSPSSYYSSGN